MTEKLDQDIRRLIDGELESSDIARVLREAADNADARDLLSMEFRLHRTFEEQREAAWAVPDGFSSRVMQEVRRRGAQKAPETSAYQRLSARIRSVGRALVTARPIMLRPAYGLILFLAAAVGVLLIGGPDSQPLEDVQRTVAETSQNTADEKVLVPFVYVDGGASSVGVAGDFNSWEPTSLQRKNVDGRVVWTALVPVPRGEHRYMFVIDGHRWESDPLAPVHRDDGFGNSNAILAL